MCRINLSAIASRTRAAHARVSIDGREGERLWPRHRAQRIRTARVARLLSKGWILAMPRSALDVLSNAAVPGLDGEHTLDDPAEEAGGEAHSADSLLR